MLWALSSAAAIPHLTWLQQGVEKIPEVQGVHVLPELAEEEPICQADCPTNTLNIRLPADGGAEFEQCLPKLGHNYG